MDRSDIADVNGNSNTSEILRFHYHQQALGCVTEITQPTGAVVEWTTYDVYGQPTLRAINGNVVAQSAVGNPYLYTGREFDPESGLYFYRARHYDPTTGGFLQRDKLGFVDGLRLYAYAASNPSTFVDAMGLKLEFRIEAGASKEGTDNRKKAVEEWYKNAKEASGLDGEDLKWKENEETGETTAEVTFKKPEEGEPRTKSTETKDGEGKPLPTSSTLAKSLLDASKSDGVLFYFVIVAGHRQCRGTADRRGIVLSVAWLWGNPYKDFWSGVFIVQHEIDHLLKPDDTEKEVIDEGENKTRDELGWEGQPRTGHREGELPGKEPDGGHGSGRTAPAGAAPKSKYPQD